MRRMKRMRYHSLLGRFCAIATLVGVAHCLRAADEVSPALAEKIEAATRAIEANSKDASARALRARLYSAADKHELAIADYDVLVKLDSTRAEIYDERGSEHFMLGHIDESIDDFDRAIQLRPAFERQHWKRGISYYYAGRFDEGQRQFEGYQTFDDNDVENAVWRYLCMARKTSVADARAAMLRIRDDMRVPMMQVYALYRGDAKPADVMAAATASGASKAAAHARLFYAHLYLGLYYETQGDAAKAREHITQAAEKYRINHYMWNVADVHARRLKAAAATP